MDEDLITIGELAARTRLSHKALRLYADRGLLPPASVDPRTGFRRYRVDQVEGARRIALLRGVGMPLARIAALLDADGAEAVRQLDAYWQHQRSTHAARQSLVDYARRLLSGGAPSGYRIAERTVDEQKVLFTQRHVDASTLADYLAEATEVLFDHLRRAGAELSGPVFAAYHGLVSEDSHGLVEVCAPTRHAVEPAGRVGIRMEPAHRAAYTVVTKRNTGYPAMAAAHDALGAWLTTHGHTRVGPHREVYYPNWTTAQSPDSPVADVACPFTPTPRGPAARP